ncbi:hypothetical protein AOLI_G00274620 [Acnodon oligacanthus]
MQEIQLLQRSKPLRGGLFCANTPRFGAAEEAREKLKFILGASEDYSSDDEPLALGQTAKPQNSAAPEATTSQTPPQPSVSMRIWASIHKESLVNLDQRKQAEESDLGSALLH